MTRRFGPGPRRPHLKVRTWLAGAGVLSLVLVGVQVLGLSSASAHADYLTPSASCQANGTYTVTWTVTNDYQLANTTKATSWTPAGSAVAPSSLPLAATGNPGDSGTMVQSGIPGNATSASLDVTGTWSDNWTQDFTGSVTLQGTCLPGHQPTSPTWTNGACVNYQVTQPTITIPSDQGVSYTLDKAPTPAGTYQASTGSHTVIASSTQFSLTGQTSWTFTLSSAPGNCAPTKVVPATPTVNQSTCVNHVPSAPTLTLPTTPGITYAPKTAGPYAPGTSVDVIATLAKGYQWGDLTGTGWTANGNTATYTVTFLTVDCTTTVKPATPSLTQSTCVNHVPSVPTLTIPTTPGVSYTTDKQAPYAAGETVTVFASLDNGYKWGDLTGTGWTVDTTTDKASLPVTFTSVNCGTAATPVSPGVVQGYCPAGVTTPTAPTLTLQTTPGITYTVSKPGPYTTGETVVVTATAQPGYYLTGLTDGWVAGAGSALRAHASSDTVAHKSVTLPSSPNACTASITAVKASFTTSQCTGGSTPTPATYTIPSTKGVTYQVNGTVTQAGTYTAADNSTITVVAVPQTHYTLSGQTVWTKTFGSAVKCSDTGGKHVSRPPNDTSHNSNTSPLASTGVHTANLLGLAVLLLLGGALITVVATRRRSNG